MMRLTFSSSALFSTLVLIAFSFNLSAQKLKVETGKCGYYADKYEGRATSSGEKYNKSALTCSHKTLPFNTKVRVTRLDNNKSVVVRVNDRGPFIDGYVVDVSRAAAEELDLIKKGSAQVRVEVVETAVSANANNAEEVAIAQNSVAASGNLQAKGVSAPATYSAAKTVSQPVTYNASAARAASSQASTAAAQKVAPTSNLYKVDITQPEKKGFGIQIVSLNDANGVLPFVKELQTTYPGKVLVNVLRDELNQATYKAIIGPFADRKAAETAQKSLPKKYKKTMIVDLSGM
jgi:rare lipoprotein A